MTKGKEKDQKKMESAKSVSYSLARECDHSRNPILFAYEICDTKFYGIRGSEVRAGDLRRSGLGILIELHKGILSYGEVTIKGKHKRKFDFLTTKLDATVISVDVADMSGLPFSYTELRLLLYTLLEIGEEDVGIACIGGHGRTGTLLAALLGIAAVDNLTGSEAIARIQKGEELIKVLRETYCKRAVESLAQQVYLETLFLDAGISIGNVHDIDEEFRDKFWRYRFDF